jgi:hypothetical protein
MAGSRLTPLLDGGRYFEAPRWHDHRLWLVDSVARMIMDKVGRTYVGDLGFDLKSGIKNRPYGRIILVEAGREPRVVADGLNFPNGIAISDDGRQLVVAETNGDCLASFHIRADGSPSRRKFLRSRCDGWARPGSHFRSGPARRRVRIGR